jgi:hypothetical protein
VALAEVIPIEQDLIEPVYERLLVRLNPTLGRERWMRLFRHGWADPEEPSGYVLRDGGQPVGFVGCIYSHRLVGGRMERFCNVGSWIVDEAHRQQALALILPVARDEDRTVTSLTGNQAVHTIFRQLGFAELDAHTRILPAWATPRPSWTGVRVVFAPERIRAMLPPTDRKVFEDHAPFARQLALVHEDATCLVVYGLGRRRGLPTAKVHHVSDPARFRAALRPVLRALLRRHGRLLLEFDERLVPDPPREARRVSLEPSRLYRSPRLRPEDVSNVYSELTLLDL